jgi:hypothetical protein
LLAAGIQASSSIVARIATTIEVTNAIETTGNMIVAIVTINVTIFLVTKTRTTSRGSSPKNIKFLNGTYIKSDMPESINR